MSAFGSISKENICQSQMKPVMSSAVIFWVTGQRQDGRKDRKVITIVIRTCRTVRYIEVL